MTKTQEKIIEQTIQEIILNNPTTYDWVFDKLREYANTLMQTPRNLPSKSLPEPMQASMLNACFGGFVAGYVAGTEISIAHDALQGIDEDMINHVIEITKMELEDVNKTLDSKTEYMIRLYGENISDDHQTASENEKYFAIKSFANGLLLAQEDKENGVQIKLAEATPEFQILREKHKKMAKLLAYLFIEEEIDGDYPSIIMFAERHPDNCNINKEELCKRMEETLLRFAQTTLEPLTGATNQHSLDDDLDELHEVASAWLRSVELWVPKCNINVPKIPNELKSSFKGACNTVNILLTHAGINAKPDEVSFSVRYCESMEDEGNGTISYIINMSAAFGAACGMNYVRKSNISVDEDFKNQYLKECSLENIS